MITPQNSLIPFQSTHFRWRGESGSTLTQDKIYKILYWDVEPNLGPVFSFYGDESDTKIVSFVFHPEDTFLEDWFPPGPIFGL